jgi:hypothetical protein
VITETTHVHRWLLEKDVTMDVHGRCEGCGEDRLFAGARALDVRRGFNPRLKAAKAGAK